MLFVGMIPFKGRVAFRQYIPRKPHSTGVKYWALVDRHGYMYYFQIYTGKRGTERRRRGRTAGEKALAHIVLEAMDASVSF